MHIKTISLSVISILTIIALLAGCTKADNSKNETTIEQESTISTNSGAPGGNPGGRPNGNPGDGNMPDDKNLPKNAPQMSRAQ